MKVIFDVTFLTWSNSLVVKMLSSKFRGPGFKTTGWLQGWLSLSSFEGQSNEYMKKPGDLVVKSKLCPSSGSAGLRQFNPSIKMGHLGGGNLIPHCWFSFNNPETVKAVILSLTTKQTPKKPTLISIEKERV